MENTAILAIDQGTTNTKALLVGADGRVLAKGAEPVETTTPRPGWFEQDAGELWSSVCAAAGECLASRPDVAVAGLALSNQRESAVAWHAATGEPLGPVLGWQDARTAAWCRELAGQHGQDVRRATGLSLDPMFSAPKLRWLLSRAVAGGVSPADVRLGTLDTYLIWKLTAGASLRAEAGNASRTLLFNLATLDWDPGLLELFGIPAACLAPVCASNDTFGLTAASGPIPGGIPVLAVLGDSHAALYGHGDVRTGQAKVTYGTGSSVMMPLAGLGDMADPAVSTTLAWLTDGPRYAREGNIVATGAAVDAIAGLLGLSGAAELARLAPEADAEAGPLTLVPAFSGLGAPYWDRRAVPVLVGLGRHCAPADLALAALDCVAQQVTDVIEAMGVPIDTIHADGGPTADAALMQRQADLAQCAVIVPGTAEMSALGVSRMAWESVGVTPAQGFRSAEFLPRRDAAWRREQRSRWTQAIARSRGLAVRHDSESRTLT